MPSALCGDYKFSLTVAGLPAWILALSMYCRTTYKSDTYTHTVTHFYIVYVVLDDKGQRVRGQQQPHCILAACCLPGGPHFKCQHKFLSVHTARTCSVYYCRQSFIIRKPENFMLLACPKSGHELLHLLLSLSLSVSLLRQISALPWMHVYMFCCIYVYVF